MLIQLIKMFPLSTHARSPTTMSVAEHMVGVHSPEYDHEAFLGKAEAERFDQLPPEEAKRRLG